MAKLKFSGKVIKKELKKYDKFQKLELVVENEDTIYSKPKVFPIKVSLFGKKVSFTDENVDVGDMVDLNCHIEGREWKGEYYNNLIVDFIDYTPKENDFPRDEDANSLMEGKKENETTDDLPF